MVRPSQTLMATVLVYWILACFSSLRATIGKVVHVVHDRLVNLIINFHADPENQILSLRAAALSLFSELHFNPSSLQALGVPVEAAPLGVVVALVGATSAWDGGHSSLVTRLLTFEVGAGCTSSTSGGGLSSFALHQGCPYGGMRVGCDLPTRVYHPYRQFYAVPLPLS